MNSPERGRYADTSGLSEQIGRLVRERPYGGRVKYAKPVAAVRLAGGARCIRRPCSRH